MDPIISIKNLRKNYGSKEVLKGISFDVYPGQVIGYIGPNGAGKSTTVKILCGLLSDFEGDITIQGMDLKTSALRIKSRIGYIPELAELYDVLTPVEFLSFMAALYQLSPETAQDRMTKVLTALGLGDVINQRMDTFSKGMKQKVLIASGLLHNPDIVFLDEPLSGLDANSVLIIKDLIQQLASEGKTIFYCSHMMDIVEKVSDQIVLIDEGKMVAHGTMAELRSTLGDKSLEQIFASITQHGSLSGAASDIMSALKQ